jgi:hypothetical protein
MKLPQFTFPVIKSEKYRNAAQAIDINTAKAVMPAGKCCGDDERCLGPCICTPFGGCSCAQCVPW